MQQTLGSSSDDVRKVPAQGGHALSTAEREALDLSTEIPGWGSDLDPARRPGVPRDQAPDIGAESLYPPIERQQPRHRIHKSTEHAQLTPVFGSSCPPEGLSGQLRDFAYRYSEGRRLRHWMMLIVADRLNVVEGLAKDLSQLHVPNIARETGLKSAWQHNPRGMIRAGVIVGVGVALLIALSRRRREDDRSPAVQRGPH